MNVTRFTRNASAAVVAGIAGYASYWHQVDVAIRAGEHSPLPHVIPLSVDGMLVVASITMVDDRQNGRKPRMSARVGFGLGILASISANVAAAQPTLLGRMVAAWPAMALLLVVEMLSRKGRLIAEQSALTVQPAVTAPVQQQAETVIRQAATVLPVPVSPGPVGSDEDDEDERTTAGRRPIARRPSVSPLTGRLLSERAPRV